jgi:hypothetical protein
MPVEILIRAAASLLVEDVALLHAIKLNGLKSRKVISAAIMLTLSSGKPGAFAGVVAGSTRFELRMRASEDTGSQGCHEDNDRSLHDD